MAFGARASRWARKRSPHPPSGGWRDYLAGGSQLIRGGNDFLVRRNHQERRARQRRERIRADHALERPRAITTFDHRGDDALAHAGAVTAFVDDQDALRIRRLLANENLVERHQPSQVDHAALPAVLLLDLPRGAQAHRHAVAITEDDEIVAVTAVFREIHAALAQ